MQGTNIVRRGNFCRQLTRSTRLETISSNAALALTPIAPYRVETGRVWADNNANVTRPNEPECPTFEHDRARCRRFHVHSPG